MQPNALLTLSGTVATVREVVIPPREATDTRKAFAGFSYVEVTIGTNVSRLDGEVLEGIASYVGVRFDADSPDVANFPPGEAVELLVAPFVDTVNSRGKFFDKVGYRFAALLAAGHLPAVPLAA